MIAKYISSLLSQQMCRIELDLFGRTNKYRITEQYPSIDNGNSWISQNMTQDRDLLIYYIVLHE